jgi:hypothetical protein
MTAPHDTEVRRVAPVTATAAEPMAAAPTEVVHRDRVVERRSWAPTFGPGMILGAVGAIGVIVSLFMAWQDPGVHPAKIPVAFLWDRTSTSDPSLLILTIPIAAVLVMGALIPFGGGLRFLGAIAILAVAGVFAYQLDRALPNGFDVGDFLGTGFYIAAVSGILAFISGFLPSNWPARREVVTTETADRAV